MPDRIEQDEELVRVALGATEELSPADAGQIIGVSGTTVRDWRRGNTPAARGTELHRMTRPKLEAYVRRGRGKPASRKSAGAKRRPSSSQAPKRGGTPESAARAREALAKKRAKDKRLEGIEARVLPSDSHITLSVEELYQLAGPLGRTRLLELLLEARVSAGFVEEYLSLWFNDRNAQSG